MASCGLAELAAPYTEGLEGELFCCDKLAVSGSDAHTQKREAKRIFVVFITVKKMVGVVVSGANIRKLLQSFHTSKPGTSCVAGGYVKQAVVIP